MTLKDIIKTKIIDGVYFLDIPEANVKILCSTPADIIKHLKKSSIQLAAAYAHPDNKENNARAFSLLSFVGATIKTDDGREHVPRRLEYIKYLKIMWPEIDLAEQEHWPVIDYEKD